MEPRGAARFRTGHRRCQQEASPAVRSHQVQPGGSDGSDGNELIEKALPNVAMVMGLPLWFWKHLNNLLITICILYWVPQELPFSGSPWLLKHVRALPSSCHVYWYRVNQHVRDRMGSMVYDLVSALQVWEPWPMVWIYDMALQAANTKGNYWKIRKVLTTRYRNFHLPSCVRIMGIRYPYHGII